MLEYVLPGRNKRDGSPPDLKKVVDILASKFNVRFNFGKKIGNLLTGATILGKFSVSPNTIQISSVLDDWSPSFCKTLAHEIGHLVLHRKLIGNGKYISNDKPLIDTARQLRYRETASMSDLGWVEWQANEFAMCLILPRRYLQSLVYMTQTSLGITRNLGTMYLDEQLCNKNDCYRIVHAISQLSGAKPTLIWRRLRFLGILEDHQMQRTRPIIEGFDVLFEAEQASPALESR